MDAERAVVLGPDEHHRSGGTPAAMPVLLARRHVFPDGEQLVHIERPGPLRDRDVLVVQGTGPPQDRNLMTLLQLADAARGAGAARVTCFAPYLCYQRQDRRCGDGQALTGTLVTELLSRQGCAVVTVEKHSAAGLGTIGIDATPAFARFARAHLPGVDVVVSPDAGGAWRALAIAERLGVRSVALTKHKDAGRGTYYPSLPRGLRGRRCLIVDDLCSSGSTLRPLCAALADCGCRTDVFVTHLLGSPATLRANVPMIGTLAYSDSCGDPDAAVRVLPLAIAAWTGSPAPRAPAGGVDREAVS